MSHSGYVCHTASVRTNGYTKSNRHTGNKRFTVNRGWSGPSDVDAGDGLSADSGSK